MTQQELNEGTQKKPKTHLKLKSQRDLHSPLFLCTICINCAQKKEKEKKGRLSSPACSPLSVSISFPSFLYFSTISSNWILCGDVLSPISSPFHPNHSAFSSPFSASTSPLALYPPTLDKTSISVPCLFNISPLVGGCFIYRAWDTCSDSLTERHCTIQ